jgi:hypothetical protein
MNCEWRDEDARAEVQQMGLVVVQVSEVELREEKKWGEGTITDTTNQQVAMAHFRILRIDKEVGIP